MLGPQRTPAEFRKRRRRGLSQARTRIGRCLERRCHRSCGRSRVDYASRCPSGTAGRTLQTLQAGTGEGGEEMKFIRGIDVGGGKGERGFRTMVSKTTEMGLKGCVAVNPQFSASILPADVQRGHFDKFSLSSVHGIRSRWPVAISAQSANPLTASVMLNL